MPEQDAYEKATGTGYVVTAVACEFCGRLVPVQALDDFWMEQGINVCLDRKTCSAVRHGRVKEWKNEQE